jgi:hypothetical protein
MANGFLPADMVDLEEYTFLWGGRNINMQPRGTCISMTQYKMDTLGDHEERESALLKSFGRLSRCLI